MLEKLPKYYVRMSKEYMVFIQYKIKVIFITNRQLFQQRMKYIGLPKIILFYSVIITDVKEIIFMLRKPYLDAKLIPLKSDWQASTTRRFAPRIPQVLRRPALS